MTRPTAAPPAHADPGRADEDPRLRLARALNLEVTYEDGTGAPRHASDAALDAILQALGHSPPWDQALTLELRRRWKRGMDPVSVAWEGHDFAPVVRIPAAHATAQASCTLRVEHGIPVHWNLDLSTQLEVDRTEVDGTPYTARTVPVPQPVPTGYHGLEVTIHGRTYRGLLLCAPEKAFGPPPSSRSWGLFAPTYALRGEHDWGVGDYALLDRLARWTRELGGATVGTLPLLPLFLDEPFDPSPYAAISRLLWNELYTCPEDVPEFASVRAQLEASGLLGRLNELRAKPHVDYRAVYRAKRTALAAMRRALPAHPDRRRAYDEFLATHPEIVPYATFRARLERDGPWRAWTPDQIAREPSPGLVAEHAYNQWIAFEQLARAARDARADGLGLYLDFPLGVHPDGYDAWAYKDSFADGLTVGAPPDRFFTDGQNWGFAPLDPIRSRESGYAYLIAALRHHGEMAGVLRIDHVMGLHRLFVIPRGFTAADGAYLHWNPEEFYAILCLESHRSRTALVGEDLGTVPPYVRPTMRDHNVHRMFVLQASLAPSTGHMLGAAPEESLASLNTHDLAPFAAFWAEQDIPKRVSLGLLREPERLEAARRRRETVRDAIIETLRSHGHLPRSPEPTLEDVLYGCLAFLASSPARLLSVSLEDLWFEREPQNVPGTGPEHGNWSRRFPATVDALRQDEALAARLRAIHLARQGGRP